jgi:putative ABC transport system permease protein
MFKHYLQTSLRHFRQHKLTTSINILCLSIGLVCFLLAHVFATWSQSSDRHFANAERIYAITEKMSVGGTEWAVPRAGGLAARYLKTDFPQLDAVARATLASDALVIVNAARSRLQVTYADPEFLSVFSLPFLSGDARLALQNPHGVVITDDAAIRLFGSSTNAIGHELLLPSSAEPLVVTGVIGAIQQPSHMGTGSGNPMRFDILVAMSVLEHDPSTGHMLDRWQVSPAVTYVVLPKDGSLSANAFINELGAFARRHVPKAVCDCEFGAIPIWKLNASFLSGAIGTAKTGISIVALLYMICSAVLLVACINYSNLAAAQLLARVKELGVRRVVGASRRQIVAQPLIEAALQSLVALLIAAVLLGWALVAFPQPGTDFVIRFALSSPAFWSALLFALIGVVAVAGIYPALLASRLNPAQAFRTLRSGVSTKWVMSTLIGIQFMAASILLVGILVMRAQNDKVQRDSLAVANDPLVVITGNLSDAELDPQVLRTELLRQPHILSVSGAMFVPWGSAGCNQETVSTSPDPSARRWIICGTTVAPDFFATLGMTLLAGRTLDIAHNDDAPQGQDSANAIDNIVVDRALAEQYGWHHPQDAVGKAIYTLNWFDSSKPPRQSRVVGVVENKSLAPVGYGATSYLYELSPQGGRKPIIRISQSDVPAALREINSVWAKLSPNVPLEWKFADKVLNDTFALYVVISEVVTAIAGLALLIAMLGLIGMSIHIIGRRRHEIGVRKTLGASVAGIVRLLVADFSKPVIVANALAWPLTYFAMQLYLSNFTQRTSLTPWPFLLGLVITILIAWIAVSVQATLAARMNPATVLRHE